MVNCNNIPERQARVHTYLESLRFTSFRFDEKLDASSTLKALTSEISKLSPMGTPQHQGEVHAVEHLRNAVLGETWANDVLRAINPHDIVFGIWNEPASRSSPSRRAQCHSSHTQFGSRRIFRALSSPFSGQHAVSKPGNMRKTSHSWIHLVGSERWDGQRRKTLRRNGVGRDGRRRTCYNPICKSPNHMLMAKKCDQSGMRNYVEGKSIATRKRLRVFHLP
jgi:hypothetical protein